MTGTPIENRLDELWSIFDFIMPGYLFNHRQFGKRFVNPIQAGDQAALTQLQEMTAPFILRRTKKQVLKEIPDKMEETYFVGMSKAQQDLYNAHVARLKDRLNNTDEAEFKTPSWRFWLSSPASAKSAARHRQPTKISRVRG